MVKTAGAKQRFLARLIDAAILAAVIAASVWGGTKFLSDPGDIVEYLLGWGFTAVLPAIALAIVLADEARTGQSPGKAALGIRTVGPENGTPGPARTLLRFAVGRRATKTRVVHDGPFVPVPTASPMWRDARTLRIAAQILVAVLVVVAVRWLFNNLISGMDDKGIPRDFDSLLQPTNFDIRDSGFNSRSPLWKAFLVGIQNTVLSASVGILIASVLGLFVGIARLSANKLVSRLATIYVESLRNIPPLIVIIFFGFALFTFGPLPAWAISRGQYPWVGSLPGTDSNYLIISKDRWGIPSLASANSTGWFWLLVLAAAAIAVAAGIWRTRRNIATGIPHRRMAWSLGIFAAIVVVSFIALGGPYGWSWPAISESGRNISGGFSTNAGYLALTIALGCYTASFVAEIVRGSIQALPRGQSEAASAVGLNTAQQYRHVILPQALRIAIPPYISECLNLTKNTSLGIVVGYFEITMLTQTAIGNGNPAPQLLGILMATYLSLSIIISAILNLYNRSIQLKER